MESRKMVQMNLFSLQQWRQQTLRTDLWMWLGWWGGEGEMYGEENIETYITICKIDHQWEFAVEVREIKPELGDNLEGWDGDGDGRDVQLEGDMGKSMADSC